jgi:protein SCO1/2
MAIERMMIMIHKSACLPAAARGVVGSLGLMVAMSCLVAGCGGKGASSPTATDPSPAPNPAPEPPGPMVTNYPLQGVVRSLVPKDGRVLIKHRAIPGFMPAMTMPFQLADPSSLESIQPGDEVEGTLRVVKEDGAVKEYHLVDLKVTRPAEPPARVIEISKGKVQVREQPRRLEPGDPVPDFAMTGQDGKTIKLSDLRGKVVVLTFIYTRCPMPDFCPLMDRKFLDLAQHLAISPEKAGTVRLISLSFDPEHDTPEVLRKHAQVRGAIPPLWTYAVASHPELVKIAAPLGLFFGPDGTEIAHNLCTAVIDREGKLARVEVGTRPNHWETADFLRTIDSLLPNAGR